MWVALQRFVGVVGGTDRVFAAGDEIPDADADEMGLDQKRDLAQRVEDGDAESEEA